MASSSEKMLLKQITELTRQIEMQKKGQFGNKNHTKRKFRNQWTKNKAGSCKTSAFLQNSQPSSCSAAMGALKRPVFTVKTSATSKVSVNVALKAPVQQTVGRTANIFMNPNFKPSSAPSNVHVNPNFRSPTRPPPPEERGASSPSSSTLPSATPPAPTARSAAMAPPSIPRIAGGPAPGPSTRAGPVPVPSTRAGPVPVPSTPGGASPRVSGGAPAVVPARRRTRSLSQRYRLLTRRKLVRRRSKEAASPAVQSRQRLVPAAAYRKLPADGTGSPLWSARVRPAGTSLQSAVRPGPARKATVTRFKLVRTQPAAAAAAAASAGGPLRRAATSPSSATAAATSSAAAAGRVTRYTLVRGPAGAARCRVVRAAAGGGLRLLRTPGRPVSSQHRTWRRRSSSSSSASATRLTSAGNVKLGSTRLVNIGGLLYKSTGRKLQRALLRTASPATTAAKVASPRCITVRGARYRVEPGGRSLRRLDGGAPSPPRLDIGGLTFRPAADGTLAADTRRQLHSARISRAKSRSLAVLRDSLRLSRQPCRFFCRLGRCQRHQRGACPHVHDPALRPVCTRHLQGGCRRPGCTFNHQPRPEKLPMCLHFLRDECRREPCPYQHVAVDPDAPLCAKFLAGFCPRGTQCLDKHLYICPEFSEEGRCPRGVSCPLAHRPRRRRRRSSLREERPPRPAPPRGGSRYYAGRPEQPPPADDSEEEGETGEVGVRRPMAEMPSFIAIGDLSSDDEA